MRAGRIKNYKAILRVALHLWIFLGIFLIPYLSHAREFLLEKNPVFEALLKEFKAPSGTPEVYLLSEKYRLDLTLMDLIDQVSIISLRFPQIQLKLKAILSASPTILPVLEWWSEVKKSAENNEDFYRIINRELYLQFYSPEGIALIPDYRLIDFQKIQDNGRLVRIKKYNLFAGDPEGKGLLSAFQRMPQRDFSTPALTVSKLKWVEVKSLNQLRKRYYQMLSELYQKHDPSYEFRETQKGMKADDRQLNALEDSAKAKQLFQIIHELPEKNKILFLLSEHIKNIPQESGMMILTPSFIRKNFDEMESFLREYTLSEIIRSEDDEYLLLVRNFIKKNIYKIESDLKSYNERQEEKISLLWKNRSQKPLRREAIFNLEALLKLYPDSPWLKSERGVIIDRQGREIFFHENNAQKIGHFFLKLGKNLTQPQTYLSLLAGTTILMLAPGNIPLATTTQKLVKNAIATLRYNQEWEEFLLDAPKEIIETLLLTSGAGAGRFYKIFALGSGQGFIQSLLTGQNPVTGAAVGAGLQLTQYYLLPQSFSRPMLKATDAKALAINRKLELLEKTIRSSFQGGITALIEGDNAYLGALKGAGYGFLSAKLVIWFAGTRYYPFKDWPQDLIDQRIEAENNFQNLVGRGGEYTIDRRLILDANFRVGGVLPDWISASITLPGSVLMHSSAFSKLSTLTHEASHLMQQHQSGVFGFYLFRYLPTAITHAYINHPDENFLFRLFRPN